MVSDRVLEAPAPVRVRRPDRVATTPTRSGFSSSSFSARTPRTSSEEHDEDTRMGLGGALADRRIDARRRRFAWWRPRPSTARSPTVVGGAKVSVTTLAKPTEDPHFVDAKPCHIVTLNRADVLIEGGAELEVGWLPPLLEGARNAKLAAGAPGHLRASEGIQLLDVPAALDRSQGDIHAAGNPHFMMDPANGRVVAKHIADAFCALDAAVVRRVQEEPRRRSRPRSTPRSRSGRPRSRRSRARRSSPTTRRGATSRSGSASCRTSTSSPSPGSRPRRRISPR